jgi:hypothetical protein
MKIDSHKFKSAPRLAELSQPAPAAARNTGIVPSAKRPPSDGFESATTRTPRATTGNTGVTGGAVAGKTKLNMDFKLDPSLEPHRELFAKVGARIAKLPTAELRAKAIDSNSSRLAKLLKQPLDIVKGGVTNATMAALKGPTTLNDPQECLSYRADRWLNHSPTIKSMEGRLKDIGLSLSKDTSLKGKSAILDAARPQLDQLGLKGRELKIAERYILGLVREDRALTGANSQGGARLPRINSGTFHILPYGER